MEEFRQSENRTQEGVQMLADYIEQGNRHIQYCQELYDQLQRSFSLPTVSFAFLKDGYSYKDLADTLVTTREALEESSPEDTFGTGEQLITRARAAFSALYDYLLGSEEALSGFNGDNVASGKDYSESNIDYDGGELARAIEASRAVVEELVLLSAKLEE